jgi:integrase
LVISRYRPQDASSSPSWGSVHRRCGCRGEHGRQLGFSCPTLAIDPDHGRWYFAVQVDGPDGRRQRIRKGGYTSRVECEQAVAQAQALPSVEASARTWTVARFLRFWLSSKEKELRPSPIRGYTRTVEHYLVPELGHHRLSKLRVKHVRRALDRILHRITRTGRLISPATVHRIRAVLRSALHAAHGWGLTGINAAVRHRLPHVARVHPVVWLPRLEQQWRHTGARPRVACWDLPHLASFLQEVRDQRLFSLWWLIALRGLRRGEACALRWADLDLVAATVWVREQVQVIAGTIHIGPTKSVAGVRVLTLDEQTVAFLREYADAERVRLGRNLTADEFLFTNGRGLMLRPEWLTRTFRRWVTSLDLPPVRLHDLRHGAASLTGMAGVDLKVIQHDMGHSSAVTTADTYQHVFAAHAHREVAKTAALLLAHAKVRLALGPAFPRVGTSTMDERTRNRRRCARQSVRPPSRRTVLAQFTEYEPGRRVGQIPQPLRRDARVRVRGEGVAAVTQKLLHRADVSTRGQRRRRRRVTQIVQPHRRQPRSFTRCRNRCVTQSGRTARHRANRTPARRRHPTTTASADAASGRPSWSHPTPTSGTRLPSSAQTAAPRR